MPDKYLHIISFDIPYPPNYGGVIDVFYKLKALHKQGIKIKLHCFEYPGRNRSEELNKYCEDVFYYPRVVGLRAAFSTKPYIVAGRRSKKLINRLLEDNYPILFEGLHSCYYIDDKRLAKRFKIYRESNIEHRYYINLFKVENNIFNKAYFLFASAKLWYYQQVLKHASLMLVVSQHDAEYLHYHFPENEVEYLPSFHANEVVDSLPGKGQFALYNGNIEVPENAHAVKFLIKEVFNGLDNNLVVAGMNPPEYIQNLAEEHTNVEIVANPDDAKMFSLIKDAHVNILVTFQATGLKLKLLNTLYKGRFCLVNSKMLNGTGLDELCYVGDTAGELQQKLKNIFEIDYRDSELAVREQILGERYSNEKNAKRLIQLVFTDFA